MSSVPFLRDGVRLSGFDVGNGPPVVFQHGLGGDAAQVAEVFPDSAGLRRLTLECRGQGASEPGEPHRFSIATFADDVLAFCEGRGVSRFAIGGISMGAAIALRIAVKAPERVQALVLGRPAWLWDSAPQNMQPLAEVAEFLRWQDSEAARGAFEASQTARMLARSAPDNLATLRGFLNVRDRDMVADLLGAIAADGPGVAEAEVAELRIPTLIIGTRDDHIHPLNYAETLAKRIDLAHFVEITPKAINRPRYAEEFRAALAAFLTDL